MKLTEAGFHHLLTDEEKHQALDWAEQVTDQVRQHFVLEVEILDEGRARITTVPREGDLEVVRWCRCPGKFWWTHDDQGRIVPVGKRPCCSPGHDGESIVRRRFTTSVPPPPALIRAAARESAPTEAGALT